MFLYVISEEIAGPNFIHPPTPENTLLGVRGGIKGGGKVPVAYPPQDIDPHPLPLKHAIGPEMGAGGGGRTEFLPGFILTSLICVSLILLQQ